MDVLFRTCNLGYPTDCCPPLSNHLRRLIPADPYVRRWLSPRPSRRQPLGRLARRTSRSMPVSTRSPQRFFFNFSSFLFSSFFANDQDSHSRPTVRDHPRGRLRFSPERVPLEGPRGHSLDPREVENKNSLMRNISFPPRQWPTSIRAHKWGPIRKYCEPTTQPRCTGWTRRRARHWSTTGANVTYRKSGWG